MRGAGSDTLLALLLAAAVIPTAGAHVSTDRQVEDLTRLIAANPRDPLAYVRRGDLHRLERRWEAAESDFLAAQRLDPGQAAPTLGRARLRLDRAAAADAAQARALLDDLIARQPGHAEALALRCRALRRLGMHLDAARDANLAIAAIPLQVRPSPDLYLERSRALAAAGTQHLEEALKGLQEGVTRLGGAVALELEALDLEVELGRLDAALARVDRLASGDRRQERWLLRRGRILERAGRVAEARLAYRQALDAMSRLAPARRGTRSMVEMESEIQAALRRLDGPPVP